MRQKRTWGDALSQNRNVSAGVIIIGSGLAIPAEDRREKF